MAIKGLTSTKKGHQFPEKPTESVKQIESVELVRECFKVVFVIVSFKCGSYVKLI